MLTDEMTRTAAKYFEEGADVVMFWEGAYDLYVRGYSLPRELDVSIPAFVLRENVAIGIETPVGAWTLMYADGSVSVHE